MRIVEAKCPGCGAQLNVDLDNKQATCEFCGTQFAVDDEVQHLQIDGAEKAGYDFEKGRQKAQAEAAQNAPQTVQVVVEPPKKRKTWLWVLGWIFIFPIPLTILMLRNDKMDKKVRYAIIAAGWLVYLAIAFFGGGSGGSSSNASSQAASTGSSTAAVATSASSASSDMTEEEKNRPKLTTEEFIEAYNASQYSNTDLVAGETFVPSDKSDPHYRTEFRLGAYKDSVGTNCTAGDVSVDIISSNDGLVQRVYAFGPRDQVAEFYRTCTHVLDAGVSDEQVEGVIDGSLDYRAYLDGTGYKHLNTLFMPKPDNMVDAMVERA